ncbi:TPA: hypothetical protein ACKRIV_001395 [Proteus mirabilis]
MMKAKRHTFFPPALTLMVLCSVPAFSVRAGLDFSAGANDIGYGANVSGAVSDKLYYNLGGGTVLSQPPGRSNLQRLGMSMGWNSDLMCGNFDIKTTVGNQLNGVTAGFNIMNGLPATSTAPVPAGQCNGAACRRFANSEEAAQGVTQVLGSKSVRTCTNPADCQSGGEAEQPGSSQPGTGLAPVLETTTRENLEQLHKLVNSRGAVGAAELAKLKTGSLTVSRGVIEALRRDPDKTALTQRLAGELAMADTMELALTMRRMLITGQGEPNAGNFPKAQEIGNQSVDQLDREIGMLQTEMEVRKSIANNAMLTVIERDQQRTQANPATQTPDNTDVRVQGLEQNSDTGGR